MPGAVTSSWVVEGVIQTIREHVGQIYIVEAGQILVDVEKTNGGAAESSIDGVARIVKGGTIGATNRTGTPSDWPATDADVYSTYGSPSDLWGETWEESDIENSGFGFAISGNAQGAPNGFNIDHIQIKVLYTTAAVGGTSTSTEGGIVSFANNAAARNFTINSGTTTAPSGTLSISGNYTNNGVFQHNSGTTTANGTAIQAFTGGLSGSSAFYNFEVSNNTATTTFASPASTTNNFYANSSNSRISFLTGATSTFQNFLINGQSAGNEIYIHSTSTGTQSKLSVPGLHWVNYANIKDSYACAQVGNLTATSSVNGGNNNCWTFPAGAVATLTQSNYQWFLNDGNIGTGGEKASLNSSANLNDGSVLRLRMNVLAATAALTSQAFDLQFGTLVSSCSAVADWGALGIPASASVWRGYDNSTLSDGANLTTLLLPNSNVLETYEENGLTSSLANSIAVGERGEFDWVLQNNGATAETTYCFRMIKNGGTTFTHDNYPQITAASADTSKGGSEGSGGAANPPGEVQTLGGENNHEGGDGSGGGSPPPGEVPTPPPPGGAGEGGGGDTSFLPLLRFFARPYYFIGDIFGILGYK